MLLDAIARAARLLHAPSWDGRDDPGVPVPDGTYAIKLRARSGDKQFNTSRKIVVDTTAPRPASMTVTSATLAARRARRVPGDASPPADPGSVVLEARPFDGGDVGAHASGPRPVRADRSRCAGTGTAWARRRRRRSGPGLYVIRASLRDAARNALTRERTCWVGYIAGHGPAGASGRAGDRGGRDAAPHRRHAASRLDARSRWCSSRRTGVPGETFGDPLGAQVGGGAQRARRPGHA